MKKNLFLKWIGEHRYGVFFVFIAAAYCFPFLGNISNWGGLDWDQYMFWHEAPRVSILQYGQFPLWNPFAGGGNVLLAHPQSCFLSPFFILTLVFGAVIGVKLEMTLLFLIGLFSADRLGRYVGLSRGASFLSACIFMLCATNALHLTEGHMEWSFVGLVPLAVLFFLKAIKKIKYLFASALAIAVMFLGGDAYLFIFAMIYLFILAVCLAIGNKQAVWVKNFFILCFCLAGLVMVKLLPTAEFYLANPRVTIEGEDRIGRNILYKMFLSRDQREYYDQTTMAHIYGRLDGDYLRKGWHEYGAYLGLIPLALAVVGLIRSRRIYYLIFPGIFFALLVLGDSSPLNIWRVLKGLPVLSGLQLPSRNAIFVVLTLSMLSGLGLDYLKNLSMKNVKAGPIGSWSLFALAAFVVLDLLMVDLAVLKTTFSLLPVTRGHDGYFSHREDKLDIYDRPSRSNMLSMLFSGKGTVNSYEVMSVEKGELYIESMDETALDQWKAGTGEDFNPEIGLNRSYFFFDKVPDSAEDVGYYSYFYSPRLSEGLIVIRKLWGRVDLMVNDTRIYTNEEGMAEDLSDETELFRINQGWNKIAIRFYAGSRFRLAEFSRPLSRNYSVREDIYFDAERQAREFPERQAENHIFIHNPHQDFHWVEFSPNKMRADVSLSQEGTVSLNQNFYPGWKLEVKDKGGKRKKIPAVEHDGLPSIELPAGKYELAFVYEPDSFKIGLLISMVTFGAMVYIFKREL